MIDHEIAATSLTATASTQTQSPHQAAPPWPGAARPELWTDPRDIHSTNRWQHATQSTLEELDTYDRAESLLHESQQRRRQHQQSDRESTLGSTEAHEPLSRCWVHEASYVRWYNFYIRNGEAAAAARAMASYQAGESRCILCCLFDGPGDAASHPAPATEHDSHPDAPFHTTSTDGHDDSADSDGDGAPATPNAADNGGHAADGGPHATDPWPPAPPRSALITEPRQPARDATDPYIAATGPPPHGPPGPTHVRTAHQPPAPVPPLSPRPTPPPTAPPTPAQPPGPSPTPTPTPQQPPQQSGAPRTRPGIAAGLLTATALAALALRDERPDRPRDIARTATRRARQPPRLALLGGILLLAAAAHSLPKAASSPAPAPDADRATPPPPLAATNGQGAPAPAAYAANLAHALAATDIDATTQMIIDHEISATSDTATAGHLQSGDAQAPPPVADDDDGATAQAAETAVAVPPSYLSRSHQAAHDPRTRPRWRPHDTRRWLAPDDAEPLERTPATLHRYDITVRDAITALYCHQPITRGALAIGHGWRTCATCIPSGVLGHEPWQCQRVGAITMRWELRDPWSNAVYCCVSCYASGGQEHDEWDASESGALPCTSEWPEEILTTLLGPPPAHHQHADPTGPPVASIHLAAHMDDAADPTEDADAEGYQLAALIFEDLRTATRHENAPTVVLITVLHLLRADDLAEAVAAVVPGLQAAMEATPPHETHTTPPGSPDSQERPQQPTPPSPPRNCYQDATPTERRPPPPFPRPEPDTGRPPPPLPPPPPTITEEHAHDLARRMAREDDADRIQDPYADLPEHDIRTNYHAMSRQTKAAQDTLWMLQAHIDHFQARRTEQNRLDRATTRQWRMRDWLVRNIDTDEAGTETVRGLPSCAWNTDLEGYLSTDTHCGNTDEYYWGDHHWNDQQAPPPPPPPRSDEDDVFVDDDVPSDDGAAPPAPSDDGSVFLDDGDTNSSDYYYSPASHDEAATENGTVTAADPAPANDSPYRTSTQTTEHDREPAPTDMSTPEPATEPAHVDSDAPADDRGDALDEHDDEATAKAPDTSAPSTQHPSAADDPVAAARPDQGTQSHAHPPPNRPEPAPKRVREDASSAGPAQAALQHRSWPETVHASGATRPAPPPPHPDIQIAQCTTPGCSRPPLFTGGACCRDCGDAARTGTPACHSPECDAFHRDHPPGIPGDGDDPEPAPPSVPHAPDAPPDAEATPPPRPLSLPTPAPRRTPTPTPTPPPPRQAAHALPQTLPPQQSLAHRQTPCPLLWCLLVGALILTYLPAHAEHDIRNVREHPARRPRPATPDAMIALLIVLGAGAAPCAVSTPWSTHAATRAGPPAHLAPALRPPSARPQRSTAPDSALDSTALDSAALNPAALDSTALDSTALDSTALDSTALDSAALDSTLDSTAPDSTALDSTALDSAAPEPAALGSTALGSTATDSTLGSTALLSTAPDSTALDSTALDSTALDSTALYSTALDSTVLDSSALDSTALDTTLDSTALDSTALDSTTLDSTALEPAALDSTALGSTALDSTALDSAALDSTALDSAALDSMTPVSTLDLTALLKTAPDSTAPDSTVLDSTALDSTALDSTVLDSTALDSMTLDSTALDSTLDPTALDTAALDSTALDSTALDSTALDSTLDSTALDSMALDSTALDSTALDSTALDSTALDSTALDSTALDSTALDSTALDSTALDSAALDSAALDSTALDSTALDSTALDSTALDSTALDSTALDSTALDSTALDSTALDSTALDSTALDSTALDSTALDSTLDSTALDSTALDSTTLDLTVSFSSVPC